MNKRGEIFIADLLGLHVVLHLFGECKIEDITEIRSLFAVFPQTDWWLKSNTPNATRNQNFSSTSDAVKSLKDGRNNPTAAAIGSRTASIYDVPIIQTEPNITIFGSLVPDRPPIDPQGSVLMGVTDFTERDAATLSDLLSNMGCAINSNWLIQNEQMTFGLFEIGSVIPESNLVEAIQLVELGIKKAFFLGSYSGKTITSLVCDKHTA